MARVRLAIFLGDEEHKLGPGKAQLLEAIRGDLGALDARLPERAPRRRPRPRRSA